MSREQDRITQIFSRFEAAAPEENAAPEAKLGKVPFQSLVGVMLSAQSRDALR